MNSKLILPLGLLFAATCRAAVFAPESTEVVVWKGAPNTVQFAAREMTNFLSRAFGRAIPVVEVRTPGRTAIVLGDCDENRSAGIDVTSMARDEFAIVSERDCVRIAGRDSPKANVDWVLSHGGKMSMHFEHATTMGVYEFLERYAGVRFYFPGDLGEIVPRRATLDVPEGTVRVKPDFTSRYYMAWKGEWFEPVDEKRADYLKTLNYVRLRFETETVPCCHGSIWFKYLDRFGQSHPEYFALLSNGMRSTDPKMDHPGQLCWSSGIVEEMYKDIKSYLTGEDASVRGVCGFSGKFRWGGNCVGRYVDIMPQDSFAGCLCEKCKARYRYIKGDRNYATELVWGVTSNLAARLTAEGIDGTLTMMAYSPYGRIPDFPLPPNIEVMVARTGPWSIRNRSKWMEDNEVIRAWAKKLGHKVWIWNYANKVEVTAVKFAGVPQMTPRAYATYYKELAPVIRGAFAESETDRYFFNYLNYYVFSKLCWNNDVDVEALLKEHHSLMFGAGADDMAWIYDALEEKWMGGAMGAIKETTLGPQFVAPSDAELWNKVYSPEFLSEFDARLSRATEKVGAGSLEARRIALVRREFYEPLAAAAGKYHARVAAVKSLCHSLKDDAEKPIRLVPFSLAGVKDQKVLDTTVKVRKDGEILEVTFDCAEPDMSGRAAIQHKDDDPKLWMDDCVEVITCPSGDMENYFQIVVNSEGSWSDAKLYIGRRPDRDLGAYAWNSGMTVSVKHRADGWVATVRIPLSSFGKVLDAFPIEFARERHVKGKTDYAGLYHWSPCARGFHNLENFGTLKDVTKGFTLYNVVPYSPEREAVAAADAIELQERTGVDLALYSLTLHPEGRPAIVKAKRYVESFHKFKAALAGSKVRAGVLVQSILGHWPRVDKEIEGWARTIDSTGAAVRFCPEDPGFAAYITEVFTLLAKEHPAFILTDDDVRGFSHNAECFCDRHVKMFNERRGTSFTSAALRAHLQKVDQSDPDYKAFFAIQREMVEGVVKRARRAIDAVDPTIPGGICMSGHEHFLCLPYAQALAAKGQRPLIRDSTGMYCERMAASGVPLNVCRMMSIAEYYRGQDVDMICEADTCPQNLWSKSARSFFTHLVNSAFTGGVGAKSWYVNAHKGQFPVSRNYTDILAENPGYLSAVVREVAGSAWEGLALPCFTNFPNWHMMGESRQHFVERINAATAVLAPFGIPFCLSRDFEADRVYVLLSADEVARLSDADLRRMLSHKVLIFRDAALALTKRGMSDLIGVEAEVEKLPFNLEHDDVLGIDLPYSPLSGSARFTVRDGAQVLSSFGYRPYAGAKSYEKVTPATVLYVNALGGRVLTTQYHQSMYELQRYSAARQLWLRAAVEKLSGETMRFASGLDQDLMVLVRRKAEGAWLVLVENLNSDPVKRLRLVAPCETFRVERLMSDGSWRTLESRNEDGFLTCNLPLAFYEAAVLRVTKK